MTQLLTAPPMPSPTQVAPPFEPEVGRVLLPNVPWDIYSALLAAVGDGATRLTYDQGWLEIERPGRLHELIRSFVGEMVTTTLKQRGIAYEPAGATTWRRHPSLRGLDADECYHIQSAPLVAGKVELDLAVDPPPDLAIEVEVMSPLLDKVAVYRGLRVPELWRVRADGSCDMLRLDAAGAYQPIAFSVAVPPFTPGTVSQYLRLRAESSYSAAMERFETEFLSTLGGDR